MEPHTTTPISPAAAATANAAAYAVATTRTCTNDITIAERHYLSSPHERMVRANDGSSDLRVQQLHCAHGTRTSSAGANGRNDAARAASNVALPNTCAVATNMQ